MELKNISLSQSSQTQKRTMVWFYLYEVWEQTKFIYNKSDFLGWEG